MLHAAATARTTGCEKEDTTEDTLLGKSRLPITSKTRLPESKEHIITLAMSSGRNVNTVMKISADISEAIDINSNMVALIDSRQHVAVARQIETNVRITVANTPRVTVRHKATMTAIVLAADIKIWQLANSEKHQVSSVYY